MMRESAVYKDLHAQLAAVVQFLADKPEETVDSTLHALWHCAGGEPCSPELALTRALVELSPVRQQKLRELAQRRLAGEPLSHITQRQRFMDLEMLAGPQALVPRKETELLARNAIALAQDLAAAQPSLKVLDVCTGSGNVALAIAHHVPTARVYAADLSEDAVGLAMRNAQHVRLAERVEFRAGDLLKPFDTPEFLGKVDVLTCNPPYISSGKVAQMPGEIASHEPLLAFDGGLFGVAILMRLLQEAPRFVRPGGWLAFEVGLGQGSALQKRLQKDGAFAEVRALTDGAGDVRALAARRDR